MTERVGDLEISQNLDVEKREWRVEQVARVVLLLVVGAAFVGLLGPGPVSWTDESDGGLTVSYERFTRRGGTTSLSISAEAGEADAGELLVRIDREYLSNFVVSAITPTPDSVVTDGDELVYTFVTRSDARLDVDFDLTPEGLWSVGGTVSLPDGDAVTPSHFVYP